MGVTFFAQKLALNQMKVQKRKQVFATKSNTHYLKLLEWKVLIKENEVTSHGNA